MRLANNITALTISTTMKKVNRYATASSLRMSSGVKINSAKDDPAGYAISNRLSKLKKIADKAQENYSDGVSLTQTVDSALASVGKMLERARELAVNAATDTLSNEDREKVQLEIEEIKSALNALSKESSFNGIKYLSGDSTRLSYPSNTAVTYNYVSGNVPEGILKYDITSYGEPAQVSYPELVPPSASVGADSTIKINGYLIEISATDTNEDVNNKIKEACYASNIDYRIDNGTVFLTTLDEGSDEEIKIETTGSAPISNMSDIGVDAVITKPMLYQRPDGTIPIPSFNSGVDLKVNGNNITVLSTNNQQIDIQLGFKLGTDGTFLDSTGAPISSFAGASESSKLLDSGQLKIQGGGDKSNYVSLYFRKINTETLGIENINLSTGAGSTKALLELDNAIGEVLSYRASIGAYENRLTSANEVLDSATLNMETHLSTLRDTDVAYEMSFYSNQNIKIQAAIAVLSQANQRPQQILQLLG